MAQSFCTLVAKRPDPNDRLIGERLLGVSQYHLGDHSSARRRLEHMLAHYVPVARQSHIIRFQSDQQVTARVVLARILWLQGFPDQSMRAAESSIADARAANHTNSLCYALSQAACPIALLVGDLAAAEHYVSLLLDHSTSHALALWQAWRRSHQGVLVIRSGDVATGLRLLRASLDEAAYAVTPRQQQRIIAAAQAWLMAHPEHAEFELRFDAMLIAPRRLPRHLLAAFDASP